jgi:oligopeptide/dipeptide ABC transporter ATP-binding protein
MVFQDPYLSLDPRQSVRKMLDEVLRLHTDLDESGRASRIAALLDDVGLSASKQRSFPSELSGGQRQRAAIARALASDPRVLILDEAVSALDTSVQAQILNLFDELRGSRGLTYVVISHDLAVVRYLADRVIVMYRGTAVEEGPVGDVLSSPAHPYTVQLLDCVPRPGMHLTRRLVASETSDVSGCRFRSRCPHAHERCEHEPELLSVGGNRRSRCWIAESLVRENLKPGGENASLDRAPPGRGAARGAVADGQRQ